MIDTKFVFTSLPSLAESTFVTLKIVAFMCGHIYKVQRYFSKWRSEWMMHGPEMMLHLAVKSHCIVICCLCASNVCRGSSSTSITSSSKNKYINIELNLDYLYVNQIPLIPLIRVSITCLDRHQAEGNLQSSTGCVCFYSVGRNWNRWRKLTQK